MKILTPEIKQALDFITPGETIFLTGKKDSGKDTVIEALAKSPNVQKLLQLRENANAPGALITATDCDAIPEDVLLVSIDFKFKTIDTFRYSDTLEYILCSTINACENIGWYDSFKQILEKELKSKLCLLSSEVFKEISDVDFSNLLTILYEFPLSKLVSYYKSLLNEYDFTLEQLAIRFSYFIRHCDELKDLKNDFYALVSKLVNQYIYTLIDNLEDECISFEQTKNDYYKLTIAFGIEDYDLPLLKMLLCDYFSKDFSDRFTLFEKLELTFRINEEVLFRSVENVPLSNNKFRIKDSDVHSVKLFCTEDLAEDIDYRENAFTPLIKYMNMYNCSQIIMTIDTTEAYHSLTKLVDLVNSLPKNCKLHILFTHFENFILNTSLQLSASGKFNQEYPFDWENGKQQAEKLFRNFAEDLKFTVEPSKQRCISWFSLVALYTNLTEDLCNNDNHSGCVDYPSALGYTLDAVNHFSEKFEKEVSSKKTMNLF